MEQRIIALEKQAAFQEHLLDQLSGVLLEQGRLLERLNKELVELKTKEDLVRNREDEELPPHY